jgi:hypothetical protein
MAQGDLRRTLNSLEKRIIKSMEKSFSENFRKQRELDTHILTLDPTQIKKEILIQIQELRLSTAEQEKAGDVLGHSIRRREGSRIRSPKDDRIKARRDSAAAVQAYANKAVDPALIAKVEQAVAKIMSTAERVSSVDKKTKRSSQITPGMKSANLTYKDSSLKSSVVQGVGLEVQSLPGGGIQLTFTNESGKANIFEAIKRTIVTDAKRAVGDILKELFPTQDIKAIQDRFFNLGHVTAVSAIKLGQGIEWADDRFKSRISKFAKDNADAANATMQIRTELLSQFDDIQRFPFTKKTFRIGVTLESEATNLTDSDYEKAILEAWKSAIRDQRDLLEKSAFWANHRSSDSFNEAATKLLLASSLKAAGQKVPANLRVDSKSSKAQSQSRMKAPRKKPSKLISSQGLSVANLALPKRRQQASPVSMQNLIPMLNQKLPELVKQNMGQGGRLRNRTGRFAESVEVLSVSGDGLNVGFTYQTDPYAVFEGRGARDPRSLIDLSIRQAAAGIMSTKFSTGRVR